MLLHMKNRTMSSREFNQDTGGAKRAAEAGPVFITDRGKPSHVLLSMTEYRKLAGLDRSIATLLAMPPEHADIEFEAPTARDLPVAADLS
jgi:prevent-host-death family protein